MTGVVASLIPGDDVKIGGQQIDDLALTLIPPLRPDYDQIGHGKRLSRPERATEG